MKVIAIMYIIICVMLAVDAFCNAYHHKASILVCILSAILVGTLNIAFVGVVSFLIVKEVFKRKNGEENK